MMNYNNFTPQNSDIVVYFPIDSYIDNYAVEFSWPSINDCHHRFLCFNYVIDWIKNNDIDFRVSAFGNLGTLICMPDNQALALVKMTFASKKVEEINW